MGSREEENGEGRGWGEKGREEKNVDVCVERRGSKCGAKTL